MILVDPMKSETKVTIPGVLHFTLNKRIDERGFFTKTFSKQLIEEAGLSVEICEQFYSLSRRDVIRGMHCQLPPHEHVKLVHCVFGRVQDVLVDLRKGSGYGRVYETILSGDEPSLIVVPVGVAHGFLALEENTMLLYSTTSVHCPASDSGVRWDTCGVDWKTRGPVSVSSRDRGLAHIEDFSTPF